MHTNIESNLKVLVVDDDRINRLLLQSILERMGHHTILASSGMEALTMCEQNLPDMVLMDVEMPSMNGFETVQKIRRRYDSWFPIIFISAQTDNEYVLEGLRAGGDDYLFKPVNLEVLQAKIRNFQVRIEQNLRLSMYRERFKDEEDTAREFIKQFTAMDKINDPLVRFFFKAADNFSGDLVAVARTPDKSLHVLLADSAGHGLTAALAVIPITQPFYQMTAKGFDIPAIVREINRRVRDYLPLPGFVAAIVLELNPVTGTIQVWNGGCPPALLLNPDGDAIKHSFRSRHLPFGVVAPSEFDASPEYYNLGHDHKRLLLCSDGVTEIVMDNGQLLEHSGLLSGALQSSSEHLFDRLVEVVEDALHGSLPQDDIALMMLDCALSLPEITPEASSKERSVTPENMQQQCGLGNTGKMGWDFSVTLTAQQLKRLDVVPLLLGITRQIEGGSTDSKLFLVLSELFNNALDHGVLKLSSSLKNDSDGLEAYFTERSARLAELEQGQIVMRLEKKGCYPCSCLKITIKDSGSGFDHVVERNASLSCNLQRHGRGITLLNSLCDTVQYSGNGSEVSVYMKLTVS